jgi:hypothetical protein
MWRRRKRPDQYAGANTNSRSDAYSHSDPDADPDLVIQHRRIP